MLRTRHPQRLLDPSEDMHIAQASPAGRERRLNIFVRPRGTRGLEVAILCGSTKPGDADTFPGSGSRQVEEKRGHPNRHPYPVVQGWQGGWTMGPNSIWTGLTQGSVCGLPGYVCVGYGLRSRSLAENGMERRCGGPSPRAISKVRQ